MTPLKLGADAVLLLIPHRRPFVFLDGVDALDRETMTLVGHKQISVNEPVFEGHFPGLSLWPGVYTIEGMGQAINALHVILAIVEAFEHRGSTELEALEALRGIDRRQRLGRRAPTEVETELLAHLARGDNVGFAGALDIKLEAPVFAGCTLSYRVTQTRSMGSIRRFDVSASVDGQRVARGTMTSTVPGGAVPPGR